MVRARTMVYLLSSLIILAGFFTMSLYFDMIPGQPTRGVLFFLRMGAALMVGIPVIITQVVLNTPPPQRAKRLEVVSLLVVLVISIFIMMLLLPQMYAGTTWGP